MSERNKSELVLGLPTGGSARNGTLDLLTRAEIPVDRWSLRQNIWFDGQTQAVRRPNPDQRVNLLTVVVVSNDKIRELVSNGDLDLGITTTQDANQPEVGTAISLGLPGVDRFSTTRAELLSNEPLDSDKFTTDSLKGIEGFRPRLVASILRASRNAINEAEIAAARLEEIRRKPNYWAFAEGVAFRPY